MTVGRKNTWSRDGRHMGFHSTETSRWTNREKDSRFLTARPRSRRKERTAPLARDKFLNGKKLSLQFFPVSFALHAQQPAMRSRQGRAGRTNRLQSMAAYPNLSRYRVLPYFHVRKIGGTFQTRSVFLEQSVVFTGFYFSLFCWKV